MTAPRKKPAAPEPEEQEQQAPAPRDITDLARELRYAWITACAAIPLPRAVEEQPGVIAGGADDPRYAMVINARHVAFDNALTAIQAGQVTAEPWMITALQEGIIPGPADGSLPGSETVPDDLGRMRRDG